MKFFLILAISLLMLPVAPNAKISNTNELISAMQKKYGKSWYKTATFVQETTNFQPDGTSKVETWYEAMSVPGSLRIDFTPTTAGNGILFTERQNLCFQKRQGRYHARLRSSAANPRLRRLSLACQRSNAKLQALKFDLSQFREDNWQGKTGICRWRKSW